MKRLVLALLLVGACDEKMTPRKCVGVMSRVSACMGEPRERAIPPASADDELFGELCKDDEMMSVARDAASCMNHSSTCGELQACFRAPSLGELVPKLR